MKDPKVEKCWEVVKDLAIKESEKGALSEEEKFIQIENLQYILDTTGDASSASWIGGIYYEHKRYDLALKYYEQAEILGDNWVSLGLGYIWYYGRTGKVDYEKAFHYFSKTLKLEKTGDKERDLNISLWKQEAKFKIADMYKNGYYVNKDYDRYVCLIEDLYEDVKNDRWYSARPEVCVRLAAIRDKQGRINEACDLYLTAKDDLAERLSHMRFFGDLNRMNWLVNDLYKLIDFDTTEMDLYDLFYLLQEEHTVRFDYDDEIHTVESKKTEDGMIIRYDETWYKDINDFFLKATLGEGSIENGYYEIENMEVIA